MRAAVASLLNASFHEQMGHEIGPAGVWPYTTAEVIQMVEEVLAGPLTPTTMWEMLELAAYFDGLNNGYEEFDWEWPVP